MTASKDLAPLVHPERAIEEQDNESLIRLAEKRIMAMEKVKAFALKQLKPSAFMDWNETPRLTADACEHIARLFGVSWRGTTLERKDGRDKDGQMYYWVAKAVFSLPNAIDFIEAVGTASVRDELWAKRGGQILPMEEIDETNIMKKAISNMIANGVPRLLGMADLTYEDLEAAGIDRQAVGSVKFKGKGGSAAGKEQKWTANDQQRSTELGQMLMAMADNEGERAAELLEEFTAFEGRDGKQVPGVRERSKLSSGRLKVAHDVVKKAHDAWQEDNPLVPYLEWKKGD